MSLNNFCITVGGGIGDQVCAEPVIRWMTETFYKKDNIILMTQCPEFFTHLPVECVCKKRIDLNKSWISCKTHATSEDKDVYCFHRIHPVDYIMLRLFRRQLPATQKTIKLEFSEEDKSSILKLVGDTKKAVIVHAGDSWKSKALPLDVWQSYVDILKKDYKVILIGKTIKKNEELNITKDASYLNICSEGCLDLRDKLNLKQLFALISICPVLLSNDSAPVHIAGAFDNWIGLIPTCKHPDYVLPFRKGNQFYKAKALWKKDLSNYFDFDPLIYFDVPLGELDESRMRGGLLGAEEILNFVRGIL